MSLELAIAEFETLKPIFVLDDSPETKQKITAEIKKVAEAFEKCAEKVTSLGLNAFLLDWPRWATSKYVEGHVKYQKLADSVLKQGFDKDWNKLVGDYTINVCVFEDLLSLSIKKLGKFDLGNVNEKLKTQMPALKPKTYEFRHENPDRASEIDMPTFYKANLLRYQAPLEYFINLARQNFGHALLEDDIERIKELKAKINSSKTSKKAKKEITLDLMTRYLPRNLPPEELQRKDFSKHVIELVGQEMNKRAEGNEVKFDGEQNNLCLQLIKYRGGISVYQNHKYMWQNAAEWTPESLDKVITNLRNLAPVFESI